MEMMKLKIFKLMQFHYGVSCMDQKYKLHQIKV